MKKVLSVLLAALMMFATFGMTCFADEATDGQVSIKLEDALAYAQTLATADGTIPTTLVFEQTYFKVGSYYNGKYFNINDGPYAGCVAIVYSAAYPERTVQLPATKDAPEGNAGAWVVRSSGTEFAKRYTSGDDFKIPVDMKEKAAEDNYIVFGNLLVPSEQTPTISKIFGIFFKIIRVIAGDEVANKFMNLLAQLDIVIAID